MNSQYKRVSRRRTCLICGKPDWCSFTPDGKISFCARIVQNADRVSRTGWGVFYHEKLLFADIPLPFPSKPPPKKAELAPIEIRDFAYRKLIELAPATDSKEIVNGPKGLRVRKILDFKNYGALPQTQSERSDLAKEIRCLINRKFPDYVKRQKFAIKGLPGFWLDINGKAQLWTDKDYLCPMLLIPFRSADGFVQACQIRFMCRTLSPDSVRYFWLSTPDKNEGLSCGSPLHFASYDRFSHNKPILVTEGALKAETAKFFHKNFNVLASAGVSCSHDEIIAAAEIRPLFLAFDADYHENYFVARAYAKLINLSIALTRIGFRNQVKILTWNPKIKGIDDALLQNVLITQKSPSEWLKSLSKICQDEVAGIIQK